MSNEQMNPGFTILGIEHVAIALKDSKRISDFLKILPGLTYHGEKTIPDQQVDTVIFSTPNGKIELLAPSSEESPISSFLEKRGEGIHHIAVEVNHIENAIRYLISSGIQMIDEAPRTGAEGYQIAFVHPKSTPGLLIEFCQKP
ncbi:MAG: methylmalonyl-CoA epimerase [Candidatus Marinimicrobia bacterium]|nr:methylmalonyl-CoA epimerase [Candidatus Neomarinimicrobiota bacterium]